MSKFKVKIIQPVVPAYRVDFFSAINDFNPDCEVELYASKRDQLGVTSVEPSVINFHELGMIKSFVFGALYQKGVNNIELKPGDIVVVNGNPRFLSNYYLLAKAKFIGAKIVWWGHGWSSTSVLWRAKVRTWLMGFFDFILLYTDDEIGSIKKLGYKKDTIAALNNGLNVKTIQSIAGDVKRDTLSDILFIGRLTEKSKLDQLIHAVSLLENKTNIRLHVIGDGPLKKQYYEFAEKLNICSNIIWHGKIHLDRDISQIANQCRCFVYPGEVGLSLIHAFAYGLPAIVHRNRAHHMPEIAAFKEGYNGIGFDENDDISLVKALFIMLNDDVQVSVMSENAKETVAKTFNLDDMVERFYNVIERLA